MTEERLKEIEEQSSEWWFDGCTSEPVGETFQELLVEVRRLRRLVESGLSWIGTLPTDEARDYVRNIRVELG